ncbi:MAG: LPXTG cell wall anchor domain-containing protein [Lachnospiraceae bacterium]|jgi:LPXTG-motif cell wall-anchored protein|nr:LPXTG cell wall anchor domain-containing protein [Lachnospiraceae bacterium]
MRKRRWKGAALAASMALLLTVSMTVSAEDRQGASGWQVSFNGKKMESNFTSGGMNDEVGAMQPGDSVELTITLKNDFDGQTDWYMKNEVLESLEDAGDAAGGAYDYLLTYTDKEGETTTLYSSEKFGGEGRINGVGLHGATKTLDDYFYLDRMGGGALGTVKLKVALDGETLVNDYQNTLARLQMDFAAEPVRGGAGTPGSPGTPSGKIIKTGDEADIMRNLIIMFISGLALLTGGLLLLRRKKEDCEEGKKGEI